MTDEVAPMAKILNLGCGETCPENTSMKKPAVYDSAGTGFGTQDHCTRYPIMDEYADDLDVSVTYFRALMEL